MFAIPGQTMDIWRATLAEAVAMGSEHLSSYEVIYEEDTPLYAQLQAKEFDVDEDLACDMYEELVERATNGGYRQYEIANFARDQSESNVQRPMSNVDNALTVDCGLRTVDIPFPRLQTQRQLLARRLVLRLGAKRNRLRPRCAHKELVKHATLLRAVGKRKASAPLNRARN